MAKLLNDLCRCCALLLCCTFLAAGLLAAAAHAAPEAPVQTAAPTRVLTDALGRTVHLPPANHIRRLVALGSSMAFITYLNAQDLVVGVEDFDKSDDLAKPYVLRNRERFRDLPVIGKAGAVRLPDYERIVALRPDGVFIVSTDPGEPDLIQRKLRRPVVAVSQGQPRFDQKIFPQSIRLTGQVLGREDRAAQLIQGIHHLAERLAYRPSPQERRTADVGGLSYKGNQDLRSTAGRFLPLELAGLDNVADSAGRAGHFFVNKEFLLAANPPLIFIDANGLPLIREGLRTDPGYYRRLKALNQSRVWLVLPHTAYFNNPEILYINAFFMAKAAYPEHYATMNPEAEADAIFTLFNGAPQYKDFVRLCGRPGRLQLTEAGLESAP